MSQEEADDIAKQRLEIQLHFQREAELNLKRQIEADLACENELVVLRHQSEPA